MLKQVAVAVGLACACLPALAYENGSYARETLNTLINDYPGRYSGTANFAGATSWMEERMGVGYTTTRQDFNYIARNGSARSAQNVIAYNTGLSNDYIITGAHFDTYYGRPTLQGVDDNGSGASVLTEIARNLSGIQTEKTLVFAAFGAEEDGLKGSKAMVAELVAQNGIENLKGMINIDSMVTGDKLYAHAGSDSVANPELTTLRDQMLRIGKELNIDITTNPGGDPGYPAGTGCCSDGESFEGINIPVLFLEATNWDLGDLDGYTQTDNPAIPGGATWHNPNFDNEAFLNSALGQARIDERLRDVSRLVTRLLLESSSTDLLHSAYSAAAMQDALQDSLKRQRESVKDLTDKRWLVLQNETRSVGTLDTVVGVEGTAYPSNGFDKAPQQRSRQAMVYGLVDYQLAEELTLGGSLSLLRSKDKLDRDGHLESDTWQVGLYGLYNQTGPGWLGSEVAAGRSSIDTRRSVFLQANNGPVLLDNQLNAHTNAQFFAARLSGGYDFSYGDVRTGPTVGLDYAHYRVDGFDDQGDLRTGVRYEKQNLNSVEGNLGWRLYGKVDLSNTMSLQPYATVSWVREMADGLNSSFTVKDHADGVSRHINVGKADKDFGRSTVGVQWLATENVNLYTEVGSRFAHKDGAQTHYNVGAQWQF